MTASPPLLRADRVRIDTNGAIACEDLSLEADGTRVVLAGDGAWAIASAVTMTGRVAAGSLRFAGRDVGARAHVGRVGIAPAAMTLVPRTTVVEYVAASFGLADVPVREVGRAARAALEALGLGGLAQRKTESLAPPERSAVAIAQAMAPAAGTLFVETPLLGLEGPAARYVLDVLERAATTRTWLATAVHGEASASERELLMAADRVLIVSRSAVTWEGAPDGLMKSGTVYAVAVRGDGEALRRELAARGFVVQGEANRFAATVPAGRAASEIVETASQCGAAVIELAPVLGGGASGVKARPRTPCE